MLAFKLTQIKTYVGRNLYRNNYRRHDVFDALCRWLRKALIHFMENLILGIISVAMCAYLIFAMVRPEKF